MTGNAIKLLIAVVACCFCLSSQGQLYETNVFVETIAGSGFQGHVDGQGTLTMFNNPRAIAVDQQTNVYVWDWNNDAIRKITPDLTVSTIVTNFPYDINQLTMYGTNMLAAANESAIQITPEGVITLLFESLNGWGMNGICVDSQGHFFYGANHQIFKYEDGTNSAFAGSGNSAIVDGQGIFCSFAAPHRLAIDVFDNIYVSDINAFRKVTPTATVTTLALSQEGLNASYGLTCDLYALYATVGSRVKRSFADGNSVLAGSTPGGYLDGEGIIAKFGNPRGLAFGPDGNLYVADSGNHRIRRVVFDALPTADLDIQIRPALTIIGEIDQTYRIEGKDALEDPWTVLDIVTITNNPQTWVDMRSPTDRQFYRAVLLP